VAAWRQFLASTRRLAEQLVREQGPGPWPEPDPDEDLDEPAIRRKALRRIRRAAGGKD
jgi:hypothetical protein